MRLLSVFRKSLREQLRELWLVALILSLAPFFVVLYWIVFGGGAYSYKVAVINRDAGARTSTGEMFRGGDRVVDALVQAKMVNGQPALRVVRPSDRAQADEMLKTGSANAVIEIGDGFSEAIVAFREGRPYRPADFVYAGDLTNLSYLVTAALSITAASAWVEEAQGRPGPIRYVEQPFGGSGSRTDLEMALPGLFILAVILLIFPTSMALARESEAGTLRRLGLTRMTSFDLLAGLSLFQLTIGILALLLTFGTAVALGFHSQGPLWVAILVGAICSFAMIGVGLLVACFSRTVTEAFIVGNFPMMLLMFFSGAMMPIPKVPLFQIGRITVGLWDVLPTTHAVSALNKVLGIGLGLGDIVYELVSLTVLTTVFFGVGVWLFQRRRLRSG